MQPDCQRCRATTTPAEVHIELGDVGLVRTLCRIVTSMLMANIDSVQPGSNAVCMYSHMPFLPLLL